MPKNSTFFYLGLLPVLGLLRGGVEHGGHGGAVDNRDGEISGGSSSTEWVVGALGSAQAWMGEILT